jgi:hypothetical protein
MSAIQDSSLLPPLHPPPNWIPPIQVHPPLLPPTPEPGRIVFTRQLWQRTMPEDLSEHGVSIRSQSQGSLAAYQANTSTSRRTSSNVSTRLLRSAPSPTGSSRTPLTPEESPPSRPTRKRGVDVVEQEDKEIEIHETTPVHTRASSGDSTAHVCICQPDHKIPRPRNGKLTNILWLIVVVTDITKHSSSTASIIKRKSSRKILVSPTQRSPR